MSKNTVKESRSETATGNLSGFSGSSSDVQHQERVDEITQANRRIKARDVREMLGISVGSSQCIIQDVLGYRKVCARWVPHMLSPELRLYRSQVSDELLARYNDEGDAFLSCIVTGDETWLKEYLKGKCYADGDEVQKMCVAGSVENHMNFSPTACDNLFDVGGSALTKKATMLKSKGTIM
ncbi:uncharacterized protein LOC118477447 [Aplysia californica]|uniref:Uncharacterized protein LOC118477447 n=1 Tax=Aplysia californica TaxID=6500 RepID=A0ABM1VR09_APLCA|nr:uncharacterized protein LOC118477447 [Aplysia californica]